MSPDCHQRWNQTHHSTWMMSYYVSTTPKGGWNWVLLLIKLDLVKNLLAVILGGHREEVC
jgi:hypothetical protein